MNDSIIIEFKKREYSQAGGTGEAAHYLMQLLTFLFPYTYQLKTSFFFFFLHRK